MTSNRVEITLHDECDTDREQCADDDDRRDRIGHRHQWRVQRRRDRPDNVIADEYREHENRQAEHEWVGHVARSYGRVAGRSGNDVELTQKRKRDHDRLPFLEFRLRSSV